MLCAPENSTIYLISKQFQNEDLPCYEDWFEFRYSVEKYSPELITQLKSPQATDNGKKLGLPPVNKKQLENLMSRGDFLVQTSQEGEVWASRHKNS